MVGRHVEFGFALLALGPQGLLWRATYTSHEPLSGSWVPKGKSPLRGQSTRSKCQAGLVLFSGVMLPALCCRGIFPESSDMPQESCKVPSYLVPSYLVPSSNWSRQSFSNLKAAKHSALPSPYPRCVYPTYVSRMISRVRGVMRLGTRDRLFRGFTLYTLHVSTIQYEGGSRT